MEVWFKCVFPFSRGWNFQGFHVRFFFVWGGGGVQQFHHIFCFITFFGGYHTPPLSMGETICGLHVKSNRLCPEEIQSNRSHRGLLKATVLSIVITASLIKHGMTCYVSTHSASRWKLPITVFLAKLRLMWLTTFIE